MKHCPPTKTRFGYTFVFLGTISFVISNMSVLAALTICMDTQWLSSAALLQQDELGEPETAGVVARLG